MRTLTIQNVNYKFVDTNERQTWLLDKVSKLKLGRKRKPKPISILKGDLISSRSQAKYYANYIFDNNKRVVYFWPVVNRETFDFKYITINELLNLLGRSVCKELYNTPKLYLEDEIELLEKYYGFVFKEYIP